MAQPSSRENRGAKIDAMLQRPQSREFRALLKKVALKRYKNYRGIAENLCVHPDPEYLEDLIEKRTRQVEHLLTDPEDGDPRGSLLLAVWQLVFGLDTPLTAEEVGFDPSKP